MRSCWPDTQTFFSSLNTSDGMPSGRSTKRVIVADVDAADVLGVEARFVGDRADDVGRASRRERGRLRCGTFRSLVRGRVAVRAFALARMFVVRSRASVVAPVVPCHDSRRPGERGDPAPSPARRSHWDPAFACATELRSRGCRNRARLTIGALEPLVASRFVPRAGRARVRSPRARARIAGCAIAPSSRARSPRSGVFSSNGALPCTSRASAAAISTAGTLCSRLVLLDQLLEHVELARRERVADALLEFRRCACR